MNKKIIMLAQVFPCYMKNKGEATNFTEKVLSGEKIHTIRQGSRWKVGDIMEFRKWTGLPYKSKQEVLFERVVQKVAIIEIDFSTGIFNIDGLPQSFTWIEAHAKNDGLTEEQFKDWLGKKAFKGQIIYF